MDRKEKCFTTVQLTVRQGPAKVQFLYVGALVCHGCACLPFIMAAALYVSLAASLGHHVLLAEPIAKLNRMPLQTCSCSCAKSFVFYAWHTATGFDPIREAACRADNVAMGQAILLLWNGPLPATR